MRALSSSIPADRCPSTFELRVQTDGEVTPRDAIVDASNAILLELAQLSREFIKEWELRKLAGETAEGPDK